ncbi:MAG: hypothetical protein ACREQ9_24170 [Candidatus Binatia bacterium]
MAEAKKELDMGIPRDELLSGMRRLLERLGAAEEPVREGEVTRFRGPGGVAVEIGPMPEERIRYPILFPRTLVVLRGEEQALETLHRQLLVAFLRPTG